MFDLSGVKEQSFGVLPEGKYAVCVDEAQLKDTKAGTGQYINCKLRVFEGQGEGRFIFTTFNVKNDNPKAVEIGLGQLKTFLKVSGFKDPNKLTDVLDLVGLKALAVVKVKSDDYGEKNVVSYFKPYEDSSSQQGKVPF